MDIPSFIPYDLHKLVASQTFEMQHLQTFGFTTIVRAAYHYQKCGFGVPNPSFLSDKISEYWNINPLPISDTLIDPHTNEKVECNIYPHQIDALNFMRAREDSEPEDLYYIKGGILAITMGLGKTLIAISYSILTPSLPNALGLKSPTLIITTKTLMTEWKTTGFEKFFGDRMNVLYLHKDYTQESLSKTIDEIRVCEYDFVVTTYDVCKSSYKHMQTLKRHNDIFVDINGYQSSVGIYLIQNFEWERVFCDESQAFANHNTMTYKSLMNIHARKGKWCLSGTIVRNKNSDLWSQLTFCGFRHPNAHTAEDWEKNFKYILDTSGIVEGAICRITNDALAFELPTRHDVNVIIPMTDEMKYLYDLVRHETISSVRKMEAGIESSSVSIALLTKLRQMLIAPYLIHPSSKRRYKNSKVVKGDNTSPPSSIITSHVGCAIQKIIDEWGEWIEDKDGESGIGSPKMKYVTDCVDNLEEGDKLMIFSMFTSALDLTSYAIEKVCGMPPYNLKSHDTKIEDEEVKGRKRQRPSPDYSIQIDGSVTGKERSRAIELFKIDPKVKVLLINYRVGSEGLNFTISNKTIFLDQTWTPSITEQAASRSHRAGQTKEVTIYRPIMDVEVEKNMLVICDRKNTLIQAIMNRDLTKKDIMKTLDVSIVKQLFNIK